MKEKARKLWSPTPAFAEQSNLRAYQDWLRDQKALTFEDYGALWQWSVDEPEAFWAFIWEYFAVQSGKPYQAIVEYDQMPEVNWFRGSTLNYAEHLFRHAGTDHPAILFQSERHSLQEISWTQLGAQVASLTAYLQHKGIKPGDRVVAFLPNIPAATVGFLACAALGVIWSSCSPDFGASSVVDRFQQIEPRILLAVDGYQYNGKPYDKRPVLKEIVSSLPSLEEVIALPYLDESWDPQQSGYTPWSEVLSTPIARQHFERVSFDHPLWVLYSSGTTGKPKAITHSHGGCLLEHLKYLAFHNDVKPGERFFWYSTTGWMMWNYVQAALLHGASLVLYDGSPSYPDLHVLWKLTEEAGISHFGTSAPFLVASMKKGIQAGQQFDLSGLRSISSTGAPLPPEAFDYVYESIKKDLWLVSMSGGTDVCTAFVGGNPTLPVYEGEIQCRALGCALYAYNETGLAVTGEVGEMVITKPMPSMPIYFWNDPGKERYRDSYFAMFPGVWRHGDWVQVTDRGSLVIYGRSDATLNRHGIRIGTAEIYRSLNKVPGVADSLIVNLELSEGRHYMPLFVVTAEGVALDKDLKEKIRHQLRSDYSPRHVPDEIIGVEEIPYTISGKKLEAPVKKVLMGIPLSRAANKDAMRNPWSMAFFEKFAAGIDK